MLWMMDLENKWSNSFTKSINSSDCLAPLSKASRNTSHGDLQGIDNMPSMTSIYSMEVVGYLHLVSSYFEVVPYMLARS